MKYIVKCPHCGNLVGCIPGRAEAKEVNELGAPIRNEVSCSKCNKMISIEGGQYLKEPPAKAVEEVDLLKVD